MGSIMPKALLVILGLAAVGVCVLQQRQQSLELRYRSAQLHREIQKTQAKLWRQQLEIAEYTSPQVMQLMASEASAAATAKDDDAARE
jgi:uncharacterized protein HemX